MEADKSKLKSILLRALFIIIIVIVIVILTFSILRFIPKIFSFFGGAFRQDAVEVSVNNADLKAGDQFIIFWKHDSDESGVYNLLYPCRDGVDLNVINVDGGKSKLLCNTPYRLGSGTNSAQLEADLTKSNVFIDLPIEISFVSNETQKILAEGEVTVTIKDVSNAPSENELSGNTVITSEPIEEETVSPSYVGTPAPGLADLYIYNVIAVGDEKIVFTIGNRGGQNTGNWYFAYNAPGLGREISPIQPSLRPGSAILYTLTFDGAGEGNVSIQADSTNSVYESSEVNNIGNVQIAGGNGRSSYSYDRNDDADFQIVEMEVGRMSGSRFVEDDEIDEDDDAAVRFVVANRGGKTTEDWRFEITNVPYDNDDKYRSVRQNELRPGESVEIIVEFENPDDGNYNIKVEVDSDDDTDEENERNNDESERLEVRR